MRNSDYFQHLSRIVSPDHINMTVAQLKAACVIHRFLLVRLPSGEQIGINCRAAPLALKRKPYKDNQETKFVSYRSCGFMEYITKKTPFKPT